jgi:hypothetical protein
MILRLGVGDERTVLGRGEGDTRALGPGEWKAIIGFSPAHRPGKSLFDGVLGCFVSFSIHILIAG